MSLYKQKKFKESLKELMISMAIKLIVKGGREKDGKMVKKGIEMVGENSIGEMELGDIERGRGNYEGAKECYEKAIRLDSGNLEFRGRMLELLKEFQKEKQFEQMSLQMNQLFKNQNQKKFAFDLALKQQNDSVILQQIKRFLKLHHQLQLLHNCQTKQCIQPIELKQQQLNRIIKNQQIPKQQSLEQSIQPSNMLEQLQKQLNISDEQFSDSQAIDEQISRVEKQIRAAKIELGDQSVEEQDDYGKNSEKRVEMEKILNFSSRERSYENTIDQNDDDTTKQTQLQINQQSKKQQQQ